jgi:hypothetical protein
MSAHIILRPFKRRWRRRAAQEETNETKENEVKLHPLANIFPLLEGEPFLELVEDIRCNGVREPIEKYSAAGNCLK